jgi:4-hydroxy-tetrahydrodipicolinate reductase
MGCGAVVILLHQVAAHVLILKQTPGIVHLLIGVINAETDFWRVAQAHHLRHQVTDLTLVAPQRFQRFLLALAAERQHKGGGDAQITGDGDLAHGDHHAIEIRVMDFTPAQDLRQVAADQFTDTQLALGRARAGMFILSHGRQISLIGLSCNNGFGLLKGKWTGARRMGDKIGIVVTGASGRMGQMLIKAVTESERCRLAGALERPGHAWTGTDIGTSMGGAALGVLVSDDVDATFANADAVIDFTAPQATIAFSAAAARAGVVHVIGTTGMTEDEIAQLAPAGKDTVIVRAGNMSLGVNLLTKLTKIVAAALDEDFDIEVIEAHHNQKVDAPSGTALMLGQAAAEGRGVDLADVSDSGRDGITGARKRGDIGFSAIRGGDIVGEHDVLFAGAGERIVLRHVASDRSLFAKGALRAALWGQGKSAGEYDMMDVLGL